MKCIVSEEIDREALDRISRFTKEIISISEFESLYKAVGSHADIQCFPLGVQSVVVHPQMNPKTIKTFQDYHIEVILGQRELSRNYPYNIAYNAVKIGNRILHHLKYMDTVLKEELEARQYHLINIKQGYGKCSVLPIGTNSLITSDVGIEKKALEQEMDVLLIQPGHIELPGLNYGFIGGATGVIEGEGLVLFYGDITLHPDYKKISSFLDERGYHYMSLREGPLKDIGSIFFI